MKYHLTVLIVVLLLPFLISEAQTDVTIRKKDFNIEKSGFDSAWKQVGDGNTYYAKKGIWYSRAFDEYSKASLYNNTNPELNYKTGVSALFSDNKEKAAEYLLKALELKDNITEDIFFLTGRSLQFSSRFSEAIEKYQSYINSHLNKPGPDVDMAKKHIEECNYALLITADTLRINIENAGQIINSVSDDYSAIVSADGETMFFASRRELPKSSSYYTDSKFDENIFFWGIHHHDSFEGLHLLLKLGQ